MLKIKKGENVQRSYENSFFRDFSLKLKELFDRRGFNGILFGFPQCRMDTSLQIDALLVTEQVICIVDFKNYSGTIQLPEEDSFGSDPWKVLNTETVTVKGGSKINPFIQLKEQKTKLINVIKNEIIKELSSDEKIKLGHIVSIVCFQDPVTIEGVVPKNHQMAFFVADSSNYFETLEDIIDVKTSYTRIGDIGFNLFDKQFITDDSYRVIKPKVEIDYDKLIQSLRVSQRDVLDRVKSFLADPDKKIFILSGTTNSGKTYLIPALNELALRNNIDVAVNLVPNSKIASERQITSIDEIRSLYRHIYKFSNESNTSDQEEEIGVEEMENENEYDDNIDVTFFPLCKSLDAYNALYIMDEAHLVTDNLFANDLVKFGSGYLLSDFLEFCDLDNTERKIIFIGDPYQLSYGNNNLTAVSWNHMYLKYGNKIELAELHDNSSFSEITANALSCVEAIRRGVYNNLNFPQIESFRKMDKKSVLAELNEAHELAPNTIILTYTNEQAYDWNLRMMEIIRPGYKDLSEGDLIFFFNSVEGFVASDKTLLKYVLNREFAIIKKIDPAKTKTSQVMFKKTNYTFVVKEIIINLMGSSEDITIRYLDNFFTNKKTNLEQDEMKAIQKLRMIELNKARKETPFLKSFEYSNLLKNEEYMKLSAKYPDTNAKIWKRNQKIRISNDEEQQLIDLVSSARAEYFYATNSKLKSDTDSTYFILKNLAFIKYGWAITVHKAIPEKWSNIYLVANRRKGKNNLDFFRWEYSGICRGTKKVTLIDFQAVSPYPNVSIKEQNNSSSLLDLFMSVSKKELTSISELLRQQLSSVFSDKGISIEHINSSPYEESYKFMKGHDFVDASFNYNKKGHITYPRYTKYNGEKFKQEVDDLIRAPIGLKDIDLDISDWRKDEYISILEYMAKNNIMLTAIIMDNWNDTMLLTDTNGRLVVEFIYNQKNTFTSISAVACSNIAIWTKLKDYIRELVEETDGHEDSI